MKSLRLFAFVILAALAAGPAFAGGNKNAVEPDPKLDPRYIPMPKIHVAVPISGENASQQLEVEMWIFEPNPELMQKLNSLRSTIADKIREALKKNPAQVYLSAEEGPVAVKEASRDAIDNALGKDNGSDVLIKSLVVR